jgi:TolB protein
LYVISLDDGTTINVTNTPGQNEDYAAWSPDGRYLVYSAGVPGNETIWKIPFDKEALETGMMRPSLFGVGGQPTWSPDGSALAFIFRQQTTSYLIAADTTGWGLAQEGYSTIDWLDTPAWTQAPLHPELEARLAQRMGEKEPKLYTEILLSEDSEKYQLVNLPNVNRSNSAEKLSDKVNDSYNAMRKTVEARTGWDYLSILGDSWRTMNHTPRPGQGRISWHVCGRAVDINQGFLSSGQIELVREDIGGVTYWRVYIKAKVQDGSLGEPLRVAPWDLSARSKGGLATAQGGELKAKIPEGYYVDFTTIAADYGWERRNALSNWRASYFDIEWWHFQKTEGLSWYECMLELYTTDTISESYGSLPWWTKRPEWEVQSMP